MQTAERLRHFVERSNQFHQRYLNDPELCMRYERFVAWQLKYMLPFFEDLRQRADTTKAIDFVVSDLAGIDISVRDSEIKRVVPAMIRILPRKALRTIASGMEMNARILEINLAICDSHASMYPGDTPYTEQSYCRAAREASTLAECSRIIGLTKELGHDLDQVMHIPLIGVSLRAMRIPAQLAGFASLQLFLENGYAAFDSLDNVDDFLGQTETLLKELFNRIYTAPVEMLNLS